MNAPEAIGAGVAGAALGAVAGAFLGGDRHRLVWGTVGCLLGAGVGTGVAAAIGAAAPTLPPSPVPAPSPTPGGGPPEIDVTLVEPTWKPLVSLSGKMTVEAFPGSSVVIRLPPGAVWGGGIEVTSGSGNIGSNPSSGSNPAALIYGGGAGGATVNCYWWTSDPMSPFPSGAFAKRVTTTLDIEDA